MNLAEIQTFLGFTPDQWTVLLPALVAFGIAALKAYRGAQDGKRLDAVVNAIEETAGAHPEAIKVVKKVVRDKATKAGVEGGMNKRVKRNTEKLKNGSAL